MSAHSKSARIGLTDIAARKGGEKLVVLTAASAPIAKLVDPHVDMIIVGDSLGMVVYGFETTLPVTLDMMIAHGGAVVRGSRRAFIVVDLPFGSYQKSPEQAFESARRVLVEAGAQAVKLEGGPEMASTVRFLVERGIPVMAHIGLTPQHVNVFGGFKAQGRSEVAAQKLNETAAAMVEAGAFSLLIEGVYESVARAITEASPVPTIGIGASPTCDGQVLVTEDILGLFTEFTPKFAKRYVDLAQSIDAAAADFAREVREGAFPAREHCFGVPRQNEINGK